MSESCGGSSDDKSSANNGMEMEVEGADSVATEAASTGDHVKKDPTEENGGINDSVVVGSDSCQQLSENQQKLEDNIVKTENGNLESEGNKEEITNGLNVNQCECNCQHAHENEKLRKAIIELSQRQTQLEEFIEVENEHRFEKFLAHRERLINVMGFSDQQGEVEDGKRPSKSAELVTLLKLINAQAGTERSNESSSHSDLKKRKTCMGCYLPGHIMDKCPYRGEKTPILKSEISKRRKDYYTAQRNAKTK